MVFRGTKLLQTARNKLTVFLLLICLLGAPLLNCASASAGITTSNIPLEGRKFKVLGPAETTVYWYSFDVGVFGMPLEIPPIDAAYQALLAEKGGDALINLRYSTDRFIILPVTVHRFHLKADVIKLIIEENANP